MLVYCYPACITVLFVILMELVCLCVLYCKVIVFLLFTGFALHLDYSISPPRFAGGYVCQYFDQPKKRNKHPSGLQSHHPSKPQHQLSRSVLSVAHLAAPPPRTNCLLVQLPFVVCHRRFRGSYMDGWGYERKWKCEKEYGWVAGKCLTGCMDGG